MRGIHLVSVVSLSLFSSALSPSILKRSARAYISASTEVTEAWRRCKGRATIPASSQLPKIHPTQRPLICIINALIVPRGHRRVSVKRVAFQFANGAALSRNESNRYARWYGWRVTAQQAFVNWTRRIKIRGDSRVTVPKEIDWSHWLFLRSATRPVHRGAKLKSFVDYRVI